VGGRFDEAFDAYNHAILILQGTGSWRDLMLGYVYASLANAYLLAGRFDEAHATLDRASALARDPCPNVRRTWVLGLAADLALREGHPDKALQVVDEAFRCQSTSPSGDNGDLYYAQAKAKAALGDAAAAAEQCARVLAMQEAGNALSEDTTYRPDALTCLGEAELQLGRLDASLSHLERSVRLARRPDPSDLPLARFALARALRVAGRDPARAESLARSARGALERLPARERELAAIDAWLAPRP
jgi:tetratricopeptide (TPR) repeat protein